jgi:hypothetical protein
MAALAIDTARLHDEVEARAEANARAHVRRRRRLPARPRGRDPLWNPMAEAITGLSAESVLGRLAVEAIPTWDQLSEKVPMAAAGETTQAQALPLDTDSGERWISISGVAFFGGTVYAFRDITEDTASTSSRPSSSRRPHTSCARRSRPCTAPRRRSAATTSRSTRPGASGSSR